MSTTTPTADLYADGSDPRVEVDAYVFHVAAPHVGAYHPTSHWAKVRVEKLTGLCELELWRWGEHRSRRGLYKLGDPAEMQAWRVQQEVWEWLAEWDLVELKSIGPEDSEYFATEHIGFVRGGML